MSDINDLLIKDFSNELAKQLYIIHIMDNPDRYSEFDIRFITENNLPFIPPLSDNISKLISLIHNNCEVMSNFTQQIEIDILNYKNIKM